MTTTLIYYPNCSKGGITSVIRGRAAAAPNSRFIFVASHDKGGRQAFMDLPNVDVHIVRPARLVNWLNYVLSAIAVDEVSVLSAPDLVSSLRVPSGCHLIYEFHSSSPSVIQEELSILEVKKLKEIRCPSETLARLIGQFADNTVTERLNVIPNLVDTRYFHDENTPTHVESFDSTPLLWIGRLHKSKGLAHALRCLAILPDHYSLHVVLSLTDSPEAFSRVLGEAHSLGVQDRTFFYQNLSQEVLADFMHSVAVCGGGLLSTSLNESFGYMFHEATAIGLPVFAFDLPALHEFPEVLANTAITSPGNIQELAAFIEQGQVGITSKEPVDSWHSPRWHQFMEKRLRGEEYGVPGYLHNKLKAAEFFREHGFPSPEILRTFASPAEINLQGLDQEFVLKPTAQSSSRGIMVLRPLGEDRYYDLFREEHFTASEIRAMMEDLFDRVNARNRSLMVEEKIVDIGDYPIPRDFKAYGFAGEIALIQEINRNTDPTTTTWFDSNFSCLPEGAIIYNPRYNREGNAERPPFAQEILELASEVSRVTPSPFARIDMYLTKYGPVMGEITLTPGGPYYAEHYKFSETIQRNLGRMWQEAAHKVSGPLSL